MPKRRTIEERRAYNALNRDKCIKSRREYYVRKMASGGFPPRPRASRPYEPPNHSPTRRMMMASRKRAKEKGLEHTITRADIVIPSHCPLLDIPLFPGTKIIGPNSATLDRIDNALGYIPGNVWVISFKANSCKGAMTADEIIKLGQRLKQAERRTR